MDNQLHGPSLGSHCELAALRLLVESIVTALPRTALRQVREGFEFQSESTLASVLAGPNRDELLHAMERAIAQQRRRLEAALDVAANRARPSRRSPANPSR